MIQNLIFGILLKILFWTDNFFILIHTFHWTSSDFFGFQIFLQKVSNFEAQPKTFLILQIFQQTCFCLVSEKTFALHHFLAPKNYILEALKRKSLYISVDLL